MVSTSVISSDQRKVQSMKLIGLSLVVMFFLGIFAEFAVRVKLIDWGDPLLTYTSIQNNATLFGAGIFAWLLIILLDVVLSVAFYTLLSTIHPLLTRLMASLRLLYVAIKGAAIIGLALAQNVVVSATENGPASIMEHADQVMSFLKMHQLGFAVALFFFGVHLALLALLLRNAGVVPQLLVWLLAAAGVGYSLTSLVNLFAPDSSLVSTVLIAVFIVPMTFAELSVGLWLWVKRKQVISLL